MLIFAVAETLLARKVRSEDWTQDASDQSASA
jgi:hypothetical protein